MTSKPVADSSSVKYSAGRSEKKAIFMVGIGASAGGIDSIKTMASKLSSDVNAAYVIITHLGSGPRSMIGDIVGRMTSMPVQMIEDRMTVKAGNIYLSPPGNLVNLKKNVFRLRKLSRSAKTVLPIDHFFCSMAEQYREFSIGIVLSGTMNDGTAGLLSVRSNGGMTIVQNPATAAHKGMPESAIRSGVADIVASADEIPAVMAGYISRRAKENGGTVVGDAEFSEILSIIKDRFKFDFGCYKKSTLFRRIERRMGIERFDTADAYLSALKTCGEKIESLYKDFLIGVTKFFREPFVWRELKEIAKKELIGRSAVASALRIWVPGCSSGEEAFTMAIVMREAMDEAAVKFPVQIFATDIDPRAIEKARSGLYDEDAVAGVELGIMNKYFIREGKKYRIVEEVRESVVFAVHNIVGDPPFSNIDLISCRNLLIYLERGTQRKVMELFNYSLRKGGVLVLGNSEGTSGSNDLFDAISGDSKIYKCLKAGNARSVRLPSLTSSPLVAYSGKTRQMASKNIIESMQAELLKRFAPAAVIVDDALEIVQFHGPVSDYFEITAGEPSHDLFSMAKKEFRPRLRSVVYRVVRNGASLASSNIVVAGAEGRRAGVNITASAFVLENDSRKLFLITFETVGRGKLESGDVSEGPSDDILIRQLESELFSAREDMQSVIEELETSNEELKASNEEVMSMNEELQSANEELETSKEEMQSLNEELSLVNSQLGEKIKELEKMNDDMMNLVDGTEVATLFVDPGLRLRYFTPTAAGLFNFLEVDVGRPIDHISRKFTYPGLSQNINDAAAGLVPAPSEIRSDDGNWYLCRVLPFKKANGDPDGVVVTFSDITETKLAAMELEENRARLDLAMESAGLGAWRLNIVENTRIFDRRTCELLGIDLSTFKGTADEFFDVVHPDDRQTIKDALAISIETGNSYEPQFRVVHEDGAIRHISARGRVIRTPDGRPSFINGVIWDETARKKNELAIRESEEKLRFVLETNNIGIWELELPSRKATRSIEHAKIFGYENMDQAWDYEKFVFHLIPEDREMVRDALKKAVEFRCDMRFECRIVRVDGETRWVRIAGRPRLDRFTGIPSRMTGIIYDITDEKEAEHELRSARDVAEKASMVKSQFLANISHEIRTPMNGIMGFTEMLALSEIDASQRQYVKYIKVSCERLMRIINDILDISRIESGKINIQYSEFLFSKTIDETMASFRMAADAKGIEFTSEISPSVPDILVGDETRIRQIVDNLVSNAFKFTDYGRISVAASAVPSGEKSMMVTIAVSDTGIGIFPERMDELFQPFTQLDMSMRKKYQGTGLGLSIVKKIATQMGGRVMVESVPGEGSVFTVEIPFGIVLSASKSPVREPCDEERVEKPRMKKTARVLIVEDDDTSRTLIEKTLSLLGYEFDATMSGNGAIEMLGSGTYDLVLLDIQLPDISGFEVITWIREREKGGGRRLPVIAQTAYAMAEERDRILAAGVDDCVIKPLDLKALAANIAKRLEQ